MNYSTSKDIYTHENIQIDFWHRVHFAKLLIGVSLPWKLEVCINIFSILSTHMKLCCVQTCMYLSLLNWNNVGRKCDKIKIITSNQTLFNGFEQKFTRVLQILEFRLRRWYCKQNIVARNFVQKPNYCKKTNTVRTHWTGHYSLVSLVITGGEPGETEWVLTTTTPNPISCLKYKYWNGSSKLHKEDKCI